MLDSIKGTSEILLTVQTQVKKRTYYLDIAVIILIVWVDEKRKKKSCYVE